jgi:hypothetical protein
MVQLPNLTPGYGILQSAALVHLGDEVMTDARVSAVG